MSSVTLNGNKPTMSMNFAEGLAQGQYCVGSLQKSQRDSMLIVHTDGSADLSPAYQHAFMWASGCIMLDLEMLPVKSEAGTKVSAGALRLAAALKQDDTPRLIQSFPKGV